MLTYVDNFGDKYKYEKMDTFFEINKMSSMVINIAILVILNFSYEINKFYQSVQTVFPAVVRIVILRAPLKGLSAFAKIILKGCWPIYLLVSTVTRF